MKRVIFFFLAFVLSNGYPQSFYEVSSGVVDFLLRDPHSADELNLTEKTALDILGDLFKSEAERKFRSEYALNGRDYIVINRAEGELVQFIKNECGKIYMLLDTIIYPLSQQLVNQASNLPDPTYAVRSKNITAVEKINNLRDSYNKENANKNIIRSVFCFKRGEDFDSSNKMDFDEFKHIKDVFYSNENFSVAVDYEYVRNYDNILSVIVLNDLNGKKMLEAAYEIKNERSVNELKFFSIGSDQLPEGTYTIFASLSDRKTGKVYSSNNTGVEIIKGNSGTKEISYIEKGYREKNIAYSTPGGIFFASDWVDTDKDGKLDYEELVGYNKESYWYEEEFIHAGVYIPEKIGELIIQSWTKEGKLLGTTVWPHQRVFGDYIGPLYNPNPAEFIDMVRVNGPGEYKITVNFVEGGFYGKTLVIKKTADKHYTSEIQPLLDNAKPGDSIEIHEGIYVGSLKIDNKNNLSISGKNVLIKTTWDCNIISITNSSDIKIEGLTLLQQSVRAEGFSNCYYLANSKDISIINNDISGSGEAGIYIAESSVKIRNSKIYKCRNRGIMFGVDTEKLPRIYQISRAELFENIFYDNNIGDIGFLPEVFAGENSDDENIIELKNNDQEVFIGKYNYQDFKSDEGGYGLKYYQ